MSTAYTAIDVAIYLIVAIFFLGVALSDFAGIKKGKLGVLNLQLLFKGITWLLIIVMVYVVRFKHLPFPYEGLNGKDLSLAILLIFQAHLYRIDARKSWLVDIASLLRKK